MPDSSDHLWRCKVAEVKSLYKGVHARRMLRLLSIPVASFCCVAEER